MTFAVLRALHVIIGDAIHDIERVYASQAQPDALGSVSIEISSPSSPTTEGTNPNSTYEWSKNGLSTSIAYAYASPPPSPSVTSTPPYTFPSSNATKAGSQAFLDFPSLDAPSDPSSLSELLTSHPTVVAAINRIVAASGQLSATVQQPFLSLCDAAMGYHLPSCLRILEASHTVEILREAGPAGLHVQFISDLNGIDQSKLAHILRLLATHHILREISPDVFALNRISSLVDSEKSVAQLKEWQQKGIPEMKYQDTNGIAAFVGLCSDEIHKSSAYLTETYYLSPSKATREGREPTRAPFCFAFGTAESHTGFFGWLEGESEGNRFDETGVSSLVYPHIPGLADNNSSHETLRDSGPGHKKLKSQTNANLLVNVASSNPNKFRLERFGKAMSGTGSWEAPGAVLHGFDWQSLPRGSVIVDVGGGIGSTSMLLASAFSSSTDQNLEFHFVIQDRAVVVEMGEKAWAVKCPELLESGTAKFQVHDFFAHQPVRNAAVFILRVILHDWPDDFARRILLQLREAATPGTKLLIADFVLPLACPDDMGSSGGLEDVVGAESILAPVPLLPNLGKASANVYWMDLTMQVMFNAQERTLREIVALALSAGWKVVKVIKAPGSLFGHITATPVPIPMQKRARAGSGSVFFEATSRHPGSTQTTVNVDDERMEMIERASSRCGTPTFGSRMELSSVEEAMAKFGGGIIRSKGPGIIGRAVPPSRILKPPVPLPPVIRKKKPSPLSVPSLSMSPLPIPGVTSTVSPRQLQATLVPQPVSPIRRRMSLAQLRQLSIQPSPPPPLPTTRQPPPSPLSPRHPHLPLSRRSSHAQLSQFAQAQAQPPASPIPILVSKRPLPDPNPAVMQRLVPSSPATSRIPPPITRRSSCAQLPTTVLRKRSGTVIGPPITGGGIGGAIGMNTLLLNVGSGGGKVLRFDESERGRASSPSSSLCEESLYSGHSVLAAAARIERGIVGRPGSP